MGDLEVSWERAVTVWWSIAWRSAVLGFLTALAIGFVIGFLGRALHLDPRFMHRLSLLAGIATGVTVGIWVVKQVLAKRFKDFRIVLLPLD
ncbi:MAG: hypothetical protein WAN11_07480 [Syntrophobacteraceae bacterium]